MFQDEVTGTEILTKCVKGIFQCFLEPNVDKGMAALEEMGISVEKEGVLQVERSLRERKMSRLGGIIGTDLPSTHV